MFGLLFNLEDAKTACSSETSKENPSSRRYMDNIQNCDSYTLNNI
jgi:hypothetical protein